jgi:hypothetical protein
MNHYLFRIANNSHIVKHYIRPIIVICIKNRGEKIESCNLHSSEYKDARRSLFSRSSGN